MAISNDNRRIVTCYNTGKVYINDWGDHFHDACWNERETSVGQSTRVTVTKLSKDMKTVVIGLGDGTLVVWKWSSDR